MNIEVSQANPFSEDIPISRINQMTSSPLKALFNTIESQFFVALRREQDQLPNYLVIGAPGSGKTSLLRALLHQLGRPTAPWNLPDAFPLPVYVDLSATLSPGGADGCGQLEFVPDLFYSQIMQQYLPGTGTGSIMHPGGLEALGDRLEWLASEDQSRLNGTSDVQGEQNAMLLQQLSEFMAVDGMPLAAARDDVPDFAAHMADRYAEDSGFRLALQQAIRSADPSLTTWTGAADAVDQESALLLLQGLRVRHTAPPTDDETGAGARLWHDEGEYRSFLERLFRFVWVPGGDVRFVPVMLIDGIDAFVQISDGEPGVFKPQPRVCNPAEVVKVLYWLRTVHELSGAGVVLTTRLGPLSLCAALGPGASPITDLALQLRVEPSPDDIPEIVDGVLEEWDGANPLCSEPFRTEDTLVWLSRESGGVPGIAKRLCGALWDELQARGCSTTVAEPEMDLLKRRALDAAYEALRSRIHSMLGSAANGGYHRPLELLEHARTQGSISPETPGVRALSVMGLLVPSSQTDVGSRDYYVGMPGLLERYEAERASRGNRVSSRPTSALSRSEQRLLDVLEANVGETVSYADIAAHLVAVGIWTEEVLDPASAPKLPNRVAVLAGRLRRRLEPTGLEVLPVRGRGYMLRESSM